MAVCVCVCEWWRCVVCVSGACTVSAAKASRIRRLQRHHRLHLASQRSVRPRLLGRNRTKRSALSALKRGVIQVWSLRLCTSFLPAFFFFTSTSNATYGTLLVLTCIFTILPLWGSVLLYADVFFHCFPFFRLECARYFQVILLCFVHIPFPSPTCRAFQKVCRVSLFSWVFSVSSVCAGFTYLFWNNSSFNSVVRVSWSQSHSSDILIYIYFFFLIAYL